MTEPRFNLMDEPWIKVMMKNGTEREVSIRELFAHAQDAVALVGETPLQDTAILRFLVALNVTILYRYDENGAESVLTSRRQALDRFQTVWDSGRFSNAMAETYFEKWHDRFYLLGGDRPFYQVPTAYRKEVYGRDNDVCSILVEPYKDSDKLSLISAAAMNGAVLESGNSPSTFACRWGIGKETLTYNEAPRWLLYYMTFADCSSKIPGKWNAGMTFASSGANIHPIGENLFQTIMLCSCLVDNNKNVYKNLLPAWENDSYTEINDSPCGESFPDNLPELYTQQSRKVVFVEKNECIIGAFVAAGDRYGNINAYAEPMFAFHADKADKSGMTNKPNHVRAGVDGWKEFKNIFGLKNPNTVRWIMLLFDDDILSEDVNIPFQITDLGYGSMSCGVDYTYSSALTVNRKFFDDNEEMQTARDEVDHINVITQKLRNLGRNIELAMGGDEKQSGSLPEKLQKEYENHIGNSFNSYLTSKITCEELRRDEIKFAYDVANNYLNNINFGVLVGHGENTIGKAENIFGGEMYKLKVELGLVERNGEDGR